LGATYRHKVITIAMSNYKTRNTELDPSQTASDGPTLSAGLISDPIN